VVALRDVSHRVVVDLLAVEGAHDLFEEALRILPVVPMVGADKETRLAPRL